MEQINLNLENYEGPFDLLLKLIKLNKLDIMEVKISNITEQYMAVLRQMESLNLEVASEFFLVAATLIEIKSRELLPKRKDQAGEIPARDMLLRKLKEYEFFKEKAVDLMGLYTPEDVIITRLPSTIEEEVQVEVVIPPGFGPDKFFILYMELLDRQKEKTNTATNIEKTIPMDRFRVEDKIVELNHLLKGHSTISFNALIEGSSGKAETIVFFLAVLELVRKRSIFIYQADEGGNILIEHRKATS